MGRGVERGLGYRTRRPHRLKMERVQECASYMTEKGSCMLAFTTAHPVCKMACTELAIKPTAYHLSNQSSGKTSLAPE